MDGKITTIEDVAQRAGVSTATVSRALSRPEKVTETTRALVADAVAVTGYRVNRAARNLRTRRADAALVLLPDLGNPFFSTILEGISQHLSSKGISVLVADTRQFNEKKEDLLDYFDSGRVDKLLLLDGAFPADIVHALSLSPNCHRIVFACEWSPDDSWPSVRSDNELGAQLAIRHLHDNGHSKIGHVSGPEGNVLTSARAEAARQEMESLGIAPNAEWMIAGDFSLEAGAKAAQRWISMDDRPTALFCASDVIAFGLVAELAKNGYNVPEDLSVVGFDDIEMAGSFIPALTTIHQNRRRLGLAAADLLTAELVDSGTRQMQPVSLVKRASVAALR